VLENVCKQESASSNGDSVAAVAARPAPPRQYVPQDTEPVNIFDLLNELEELPERAKHLPLNTLVGFDHEQFYYLVLKIRANLPEDLKKAHRVARDTERIVEEAKDAAIQQLESGRTEAARLLEAARAEAGRIVEQARSEAGRIIEQARAQAAHMVDKSEVHEMAVAQAHEIVRRAETEASEIRKGADDYARDVLANIEGVMGKALVTVQRGREMLENSRRNPSS